MAHIATYRLNRKTGERELVRGSDEPRKKRERRKEAAREFEQQERKAAAETKPKEPVTLPTIKLEPEKKGIIETIKEGREAALETAPGLTKGLEAGAVIGTTVLAGLGIGAVLGIGGGTTAATTAVSKAAVVGKAAELSTKFPALGIKIWQNGKTLSTTGSLLSKIGFGTGAAVLLGAIGSYPFAGFIKEEALQTLSLAVRSAFNAGDIEGMEDALREQEELLNPTLWDKIFQAVPYANVVKNLRDFYDSARTKVAIDRKILDDLRIQQETGETDDKKWERIRQEEAEQDKAAIDYYNEQRKLMVQWELEAKAAANKASSAAFAKSREAERVAEAEARRIGTKEFAESREAERQAEAKARQEATREFAISSAAQRAAERKARNEDAIFWAKERKKQRQKEAEDRKAIADFWIAYRKEALKLADNNRPSNLNFGLL